MHSNVRENKICHNSKSKINNPIDKTLVFFIYFLYADIKIILETIPNPL